MTEKARKILNQMKKKKEDYQLLIHMLLDFKILEKSRKDNSI